MIDNEKSKFQLYLCIINFNTGRFDFFMVFAFSREAK